MVLRWIRDSGWKIRIRDKHPGSATNWLKNRLCPSIKLFKIVGSLVSCVQRRVLCRAGGEWNHQTWRPVPGILQRTGERCSLVDRDPVSVRSGSGFSQIRIQFQSDPELFFRNKIRIQNNLCGSIFCYTIYGTRI
jgi:hypothetical protein